MKIYMNIESDF